MGGLLSAALIVRDEAEVIEECLRSIAEVVDEVIVVDTGSIDDTPALARQLGAVVYHETWNDDFAAMRNVALDRATGQWILYIDADERLAPVERSVVERLLTDAPEVAFRLLLRPHVRSTPYLEYRLWRNDRRIRFEGVIHEKVVPSIVAVAEADGRPIGRCDLLVTHVGYEGDQTRKHRRNLPLLRVQVADEPDNLFNWHHLFRVLSGLGEPEEAEQVLVHAVEVARAKSFVDPAGVLAFTDLVTLRFERGEDVSELLAEARARYPTNRQLVWVEGRLLLGADAYDEALARFDELLAVDLSALPDLGPGYDERLFGEFAREGRGVCLFRLGRYAEAAEAYAEAMRDDPANPTYRAKREVALARIRRSADAPPADS